MKRRIFLKKRRRSRGAQIIEGILVATLFMAALIAFQDDIRLAFENLFATSTAELTDATDTLGDLIEPGVY